MLQYICEVVTGHLLLSWSHVSVKEGVRILPELSGREGPGVAVALRLQAGWDGCSKKHNPVNARPMSLASHTRLLAVIMLSFSEYNLPNAESLCSNWTPSTAHAAQLRTKYSDMGRTGHGACMLRGVLQRWRCA